MEDTATNPPSGHVTTTENKNGEEISAVIPPSLTYSISKTEKELLEFDYRRMWSAVYQKFKSDDATLNQGLTYDAALLSENRSLNRYRDILPYDHTRVILRQLQDQSGDPSVPPTDYINASFIHLPHILQPGAEVAPNQPTGPPRYILTQGPTPHTQSHFWQMIWENRCPAIVMLNRLVEKGALKCSPYFPIGSETGDVDTRTFKDVHLRVCLMSTENEAFYVKRSYKMQHLLSGASHECSHFHYLTWPDFGVPRSPGAFLNFLMAVRLSGVFPTIEASEEDDVLEKRSTQGPVVVHCSAGVGRSGTFVLIDVALLVAQKKSSLNAVNLRQLLLELRSQRMSLIQTWEQLRFCYQAVVQGGKTLVENRDGGNPIGHYRFSMTEEDYMGVDVSSSEDTSVDQSVDSLSPGSSSASRSSSCPTDSLEEPLTPREAPTEPRLSQHQHRRKKRDTVIPKEPVPEAATGCPPPLPTRTKPRSHVAASSTKGDVIKVTPLAGEKTTSRRRGPNAPANRYEDLGGETRVMDAMEWAEQQRQWLRMRSYVPPSPESQKKLEEEEEDSSPKFASTEEPPNHVTEKEREREERRRRMKEKVEQMRQRVREAEQASGGPGHGPYWSAGLGVLVVALIVALVWHMAR